MDKHNLYFVYSNPTNRSQQIVNVVNVNIICKSLQSFLERITQACLIARSNISSKVAIFSMWLATSKFVIISHIEGSLRMGKTQRAEGERQMYFR